MSETTETTVTTESANTQQTPPPASTEKPHVPASALPDDALKKRLDSAKETGKKELLSALGATDEELKSALEMFRTAEAAKKTEAEKLAAESLARQTAETQAKRYREALNLQKEQESQRLTEEQRNAVNTIAGDDPAQWMIMLSALRPTWTNKPSEQPKVVTPANTAPPANAPPNTVVTPPTLKTQYDELNQRNPILAAAFANQHKEIFD